MAIVHATDETFETEVLKNTKPVLVDFWAAWCSPCRMIAPHLEKLAEENPAVQVVKVDVDAHQKYASEAGVRGIPTIVLYKNGKEVDRVVGLDLNGLKSLATKATQA